MITSTASDVKITGSLTGERIAMSLDENSLIHLQGILINAYSDPEGAIVREYAVNARDATIEAGSTRPIEVSTPGPLSPFFKVRDWGCGLSIGDIHEVFSKYGASTKRGTNEQTGSLGIGSKSALAYAPQFTVSSVKNGERVEALVSLDEYGAGQITVVDTRPTDEPSGTEIVIPAKRYNQIVAKARDLFANWPKGTVLLDGKEPEAIQGDELLKAPVDVPVDADGRERLVRIERMVLQRADRDSSVIVMGGVPYPIPSEHNRFSLGVSSRVTVFVGMGEVSFAPSREALRMTPLTKQALQAIHEQFRTSVTQVMATAIESAETPGASLRAMLKWKALLPKALWPKTITYKGAELPATFKLDGGVKLRVLALNPYKLSASTLAESVPAATAEDAVWFYGYDRESFTAGQRKKINVWVEKKWPNYPYEGRPANFILSPVKPDMTYLDESKMIPWSIINAIRVPRSNNSGGRRTNSDRIAGSYDLYENGVRHTGVPGDEIDTSGSLYYVVSSSSDSYGYGAWMQCVNHFDTRDTTVVMLTSNRVDKFLRNFPEAENLWDAVKRIRDTWVETLDDETKNLIALYDTIDRTKFSGLHEHRPFADPDIEATLSLLDELKSERLTSVLKERNMLMNPPRFSCDWKDPITRDKYPLAFYGYGNSLYRHNPKHLVLYLNAAYQADNPTTTELSI